MVYMPLAAALMMPPSFVQESDYAVPAGASISAKERAIRQRIVQLLLARDAMFGPMTRPVTTWAEDGVTIRDEPITSPELRFREQGGVYAEYSPANRRITFDAKDLTQPRDWDHLLNKTTTHELAHYLAHMEFGSSQDHNENWAEELRLLKEAYGRAMVRAADERK